MKRNATIYVKVIKGKKYLYMDLMLDNGSVVNLPIKQSFPNVKLGYKISNNLKGQEAYKE